MSAVDGKDVSNRGSVIELDTMQGHSVDEPVEPIYPKGMKLATIICSLAASIFLIALDETIITTAIPRITDDFDSLFDVGWYGSAYFLTLCSFQLIYGRLFTFFPDKTVFLVALTTFEVGSIVCATAQSSETFIVGRAIAGLGSAGINAGYIIIIAASLPLDRRPMYVASYSMTYGVATVVAPIMGGAFTTHLSWRWCFWINLPFGALTICVVCFLYRSRGVHAGSGLTFTEKWRQLDVLGTGLMVAGTCSLLLILQWGGSVHTWGSWRIIMLITISFALAFAFIVLQVIRKEGATIPPRIMKYRSVASSAWFVFTAGAAMNVVEYYLPIYFQAIQGVTALRSGIQTLPTLVGLAVFSLVAGFGVARLGYFTPFMIAGAVMLSVGTGLISTWGVLTDEAAWIGYQVLVGAGAGLGIQQAHTAAQTVLDDVDVPTGAVVLIFAQLLGGTIFISVAENVFENRLLLNTQRAGLGYNLKAILNGGATNLRTAVRPEDLAVVLEVYKQALTSTFYVATGLAVLSIIGALGTEWISIKNKARVDEG